MNWAHTSDKNGMSIAFIKVKFLKFGLKTGWLTIALECVCSSYEQLPEQFTDASFKASMYVHYMKNYHVSLLTLVTCENILMGREERLRRKQDKFNG